MEIYVIRKMVGKFKNCFWDFSFRGIGIFIILLIIPLRFFSIIWDFYNVFDYPKRGYKFLFAKISVNILRTDFNFSYYNDHYFFFFQHYYFSPSIIQYSIQFKKFLIALQNRTISTKMISRIMINILVIHNSLMIIANI